MTENEIFKPVSGGRANDDVVWQIEAAILGGLVQPGERLPSERELQVRFHTGRGVVREALMALKQKGLIEIRKGAKGGAFIKRVDVATASESLAMLLHQQHIPLEYLVEFRESIDRTVAQLAIIRAEHQQKRELLETTLRLIEVAESDMPDMDRIHDIDRDLNSRLVKLTGNPLYEWILLTIQRGFGSYDHALYADAEYRMKTARNWRDTAREILAGDLLKALYYISHHYMMLRRCLQENGGISQAGESVSEPPAGVSGFSESASPQPAMD